MLYPRMIAEHRPDARGLEEASMKTIRTPSKPCDSKQEFLPVTLTRCFSDFQVSSSCRDIDGISDSRHSTIIERLYTTRTECVLRFLALRRRHNMPILFLLMSHKDK